MGIERIGQSVTRPGLMLASANWQPQLNSWQSWMGVCEVVGGRGMLASGEATKIGGLQVAPVWPAATQAMKSSLSCVV